MRDAVTVPARTLRILVVAGVLLILAGGVALAIAGSATDWLMARLDADLVIDAAAVGGATAALGVATMLAGLLLIGLAVALRLARGWAPAAGAVIVFALLAALVGSLAALLASWVRNPSAGGVYAAVSAGAAVGIIGLAIALADLVRVPRRRT